jgi:hypothetical protein
MAQRGIQKPSLLATHLIQDANQYRKPLQLVSFDMENAFDRVGHCILVQALRAFGVPEIMIMAIQHYTLVGFAYIEVNGRASILIIIKDRQWARGPSFQYFSSLLLPNPSTDFWSPSSQT